MYAALRPGERIQTRCTLVDRYRKRNRDYLVNEVDYSGPDGSLRVRGRTHQSFLLEAPQPESGFVVDADTAKSKQRRAVGEGAGPELEPLEIKIDQEMCWRFSGPHRNYHNDVDEARKFGFPAIVVQGMLTTCLVSQLMARQFADGWFAGGRMDVKLVNVAWCDETLRVRAKLREEIAEGRQRRAVYDVWPTIVIMSMA